MFNLRSFPESTKLIDASDCLPVVGAITLNASNEEGRLCGYVSAQYSTGGNGARRIEIINSLDNCFRIRSEKREDTSCTDDGKSKASLFIYRNEAKYYAVKKSSDSSNTNRPKKKRLGELKITNHGDLIPSGSNFLLLRYLAQEKFCGRFQAWTLDIDGNICLSNYDVESPRITRLYCKRCYVITIHRIIKRFDREDVHENYRYLPTGHLLQYESCFSDYIWHINPLSAIPPTFDQPVNFETKLNKDFRLLAKYLGKKEHLQAEMRSLVEKDRPEIKIILRDYLCQLVHDKPGNVLNFTLEYFNELRNKMKKERCESKHHARDSDSDECSCS